MPLEIIKMSQSHVLPKHLELALQELMDKKQDWGEHEGQLFWDGSRLSYFSPNMQAQQMRPLFF